MIPWYHMLLNSEWHVHLTYFLEKSDKKMMDSNLKKSYEHWKKKTSNNASNNSTEAKFNKWSEL